MILDLLFARAGTDRNGDSSPWVIPVASLAVLGLLIAGIASLFHGCAPTMPPPPPALVHASHITEALGGANRVTIQRVYSPVGPWKLAHDNSFCYRVTIRETQRIVWAEAYVSNWSIAAAITIGATDKPIYRYRYWGERTLMGTTWYTSIDR